MSNQYSPEQYACREGHVLYTDNVYITKAGWVVCKACDQIDYDRRKRDPVRMERIRASSRAYRARQREQKREAS